MERVSDFRRCKRSSRLKHRMDVMMTPSTTESKKQSQETSGKLNPSCDTQEKRSPPPTVRSVTRGASEPTFPESAEAFPKSNNSLPSFRLTPVSFSGRHFSQHPSYFLPSPPLTICLFGRIVSRVAYLPSFLPPILSDGGTDGTQNITAGGRLWTMVDVDSPLFLSTKVPFGFGSRFRFSFSCLFRIGRNRKIGRVCLLACFACRRQSRQRRRTE